MVCEPYHALDWTAIGGGVAGAGLLIVSLFIGIFFLSWHRHLLRLARLHKKLGPPGVHCLSCQAAHIRLSSVYTHTLSCSVALG